ncbi:hypothetical protein HYALB_00013701 [Hymenoscyphus albidus]|uniref:Uncharacterized protein n=1 Tax=Hymenoscyphus albidus TaxID=595503 RepID=A0A9N9LW33_9HELO|nr:hypothetical protein HYALB_00013701 [Hymenoscyphus albidus]
MQVIYAIVALATIAAATPTSQVPGDMILITVNPNNPLKDQGCNYMEYNRGERGGGGGWFCLLHEWINSLPYYICAKELEP